MGGRKGIYGSRFSEVARIIVDRLRRRLSRPQNPTTGHEAGPPPNGPCPPRLIIFIRGLIADLMKANCVEIAGKQLGLCYN